MCIARKFLWITLICLIAIGVIRFHAVASTYQDILIHATPNFGGGTFRVIYINERRVDIEWDIPNNYENVMIRAHYTEYPDTPALGSEPTDGYLVYSGNLTSFSDTSMNFDLSFDQIYYRIWAVDNVSVWSASFGQDFVGGEGMTLLSSTLMDMLAAGGERSIA